jgi:CDP-paratose 2-epimerase
MKVFITGICGFVGSALARRIKEYFLFGYTPGGLASRSATSDLRAQGCRRETHSHPDDLATLVLNQIRKPWPQPERTSNLEGGLSNSMSLLELSKWCTDRFGPREVISDTSERRLDIPWMVLDTGRAKKQWNWKPSRTIGSILAEIADHAEKHPDWLQLTGR